MGLLLFLPVIVSLLLFYLYVRLNDKRLETLPARMEALSPERWTPETAHRAIKEFHERKVDRFEYLPPKTGRRYIVVGGAGFLGGWIVVDLLLRGEDPRKIRIIDVRKPTRLDLTTGAAQDVQFIQADISSADAVYAAFHAPWPGTSGKEDSEPGLTVFHTAANIRWFERHRVFLERSAKVNVEGTRNVINAARAVGASVLLYTSSGSVAVRRTNVWLWPWQTEPKYFVQVLGDDNNGDMPRTHEEFFSNYAVTKMAGENLVRAADGVGEGGGERLMKTGCVRPGNGVFGPGDILLHLYLVRKHNPTWANNIVHSFVYVENCSEAHLLYEQRLIETLNGSSKVDLGGDCFTVTDPNPPQTYGDTRTVLSTLSSGTVTFPLLSTTGLLIFAHLIELYHLAQLLLPLPQLSKDLQGLQPSLFPLVGVHLVFDDRRARKSREQGGLGYRGAWTTLQGVCKTWVEHERMERMEKEGKNRVRGVGAGL